MLAGCTVDFKDQMQNECKAAACFAHKIENWLIGRLRGTNLGPEKDGGRSRSACSGGHGTAE